VTGRFYRRQPRSLPDGGDPGNAKSVAGFCRRSLEAGVLILTVGRAKALPVDATLVGLG